MRSTRTIHPQVSDSACGYIQRYVHTIKYIFLAWLLPHSHHHSLAVFPFFSSSLSHYIPSHPTITLSQYFPSSHHHSLTIFPLTPLSLSHCISLLLIQKERLLNAGTQVISMMQIFQEEVVICLPPHYDSMATFVDTFEEELVPMIESKWGEKRREESREEGGWERRAD